MTEQFVEDTLNKLADMYENRFGAIVYFNTEEEKLKELQKQEEVKLPIFVFDTTNPIEDKKLAIPVISVVNKDVKKDFLKETLSRYTPKRLKGCNISKLKASSFEIEEESSFMVGYYTLEFMFI